MQVTVDAPPYIRQQTGYGPASAALLSEFIEDVRKSGKYASVGTEATGERPLEIRLMITNFHYVHGAARALGGILAGHAVLAVTMTAKDKRTGEVLRVVNANAASSHMQGIFSPTTGRQVTATAERLASEL